MKRIFNLMAIAIILFSLMPGAFISCTDLEGDGIDSIFYDGSTLPQTTSYRNPVWEPDFELGTIFRGPGNYIAIASETQWAPGITYNGPIITSNDLMLWTFNDRTAFPAKPDTVISGTETRIFKRPDWAEGRIHSMTAGFARTIPGTSYWMFYQIGNEQAIGASFARTPMGPFYDLGKFLNYTETGSTTLSDPFFIVVGTRFYLFYTTETGSWSQEIGIGRGVMPSLRGVPRKISGSDFRDVAVYRKGSYFYLLGTVTTGGFSEIRYGRSSAITGPFTDKDGNSLLTSAGTRLIESGERLINPMNVSGIFSNNNNEDFILYNVTDVEKPLLKSGFNRRPLVMNKLEINEEGWFVGVIKPVIGWASPKFNN